MVYPTWRRCAHLTLKSLPHVCFRETGCIGVVDFALVLFLVCYDGVLATWNQCRTALSTCQCGELHKKDRRSQGLDICRHSLCKWLSAVYMAHPEQNFDAHCCAREGTYAPSEDIPCLVKHVTMSPSHPTGTSTFTALGIVPHTHDLYLGGFLTAGFYLFRLGFKETIGSSGDICGVVHSAHPEHHWTRKIYQQFQVFDSLEHRFFLYSILGRVDVQTGLCRCTRLALSRGSARTGRMARQCPSQQQTQGILHLDRHKWENTSLLEESLTCRKKKAVFLSTWNVYLGT